MTPADIHPGHTYAGPVSRQMKRLYNDIKPHALAVLSARIADGGLPAGVVDGRSIEDITDDELAGYDHVHLFAGIGGFPLGLARAGWPDGLRVVTAGFPCQDISLAGMGAGLAGKRSGLFWQAMRAIRVVRPDFAIMENVAALTGRGLGTVLGAMASDGFDSEWDCLPAWSVGAPHKLRDRIWILAYPDSSRQLQPQGGLGDERGWPSYGGAAAMADTDGERRREHDAAAEPGWSGFLTRRPDPRWDVWPAEPPVLGVVDGVSDGLDGARIDCCGDALLPQFPEWIGRSILAHNK